MGRGGQDTGDEKPRMTRKGAKSGKYRKNEREAKQGVPLLWRQNRKETKQSRRGEGNRKESEIKGGGCEEGAREPGRHQSLVKVPPVSRGGQESPGWSSVPTESWRAQDSSSAT